MKPPLYIGLIGLGHVGQGVLEILEKRASLITQRTGQEVKVKTICVRDLKKKRKVDANRYQVTTNVDDILDDPDIQIVVEVMGGESPAYDMICKALKSGKYVVTANKEVVAKHKKTFFQLAKDHQADFYYEASVGGGIPLIRTLKVGLAPNRIHSLVGILNGTTNYILTQIAETGRDFEVVLKEAQDLGFAEADPTMDVSGLDAAYKLVILAAVAFKVDVRLDQLYYEGITNITAKDMAYASELGYTIKLVAIGEQQAGSGMVFKVHPTLLQNAHPLATVRNEFNAVFVVGDSVGESMLMGKGAGSHPTGSAVVSDILDILFDQGKSSKRNLDDFLEDRNIIPIDETLSGFYLRFSCTDKVGVLEKVSSVLREHNVSLAKIIQKEKTDDLAEIVLITDPIQEKIMTSVINTLESLPEIGQISSKIRVGIGPKPQS